MKKIIRGLIDVDLLTILKSYFIKKMMKHEIISKKIKSESQNFLDQGLRKP